MVTEQIRSEKKFICITGGQSFQVVNYNKCFTDVLQLHHIINGWMDLDMVP